MRFDRCWLYGVVCVLYLACPYHLLNGYTGPLFDRRAIFAVLGLLAGCFLHRVWLNRRDPQSFSTIYDSGLFRAVLIVLSICTVGIELLDYPMYLAGDVESQTFAYLVPALAPHASWYVLNVEPYVVFSGAALAAFGFLCSHDSIDAPSSNSSATPTVEPLNHLSWIPVISIVIGVSMRLSWTVFLTPAFGADASLGVILTGCVALLLSLALSFIFLAFDRLSFVSLRRIAEGKYYGRVTYVQMLIGCICSGQLIVTVAMRYVYNRIAGVATLFIALTLLVVFVLRTRGGTTNDDQDGASVAGQIKDLLERGYGLSPREALFAAGVLLGMTGKEIACEHDVKPGTVRSTLFRAYQKLGVHGERELIELLRRDGKLGELLNYAPQKNAAADAAGASSLEDGRECGHTVKLMESAGTVLFLCALLHVLFPVGIVGGLWGIGQLPLVGISLGLIGTGLLGVAFEVVQGLGVGFRPLSSPGGVKRSGSVLSGLFSLIVLLAIAFCLSFVNQGRLVHALGPYSDIATICSYGLVAIVALSLVDSMLGAWNRISAIQMAASLVLWALLARCESGALVFLEGALGLLLLVPAKAQGVLAHHGKIENKVSRLDGDAVYEAALCSLCALCFEEWWRSLGQSSFLFVSLFLFASIAVAYLFSFRRWFDVSTTSMTAILACFSIVVVHTLFGDPLFALLPCSLLLLCTLFGSLGLRRASYVSRFCTGCILVGSLIAINKVQDCAVNPSQLMSAVFTSGDSFLVAVGTVLSIMCLFAGALLWRIAREAWEMRESHALDTNDSMDESNAIRRRRALLVSRGLSDVQTEIMLLTARGETAREISDKVCYSPATVKALRGASYRQLQVGDRACLIKLLSQVNDV